MNKTVLKNSLIVLLLSISAFSAGKYISLLKEKNNLLEEVNKAKIKAGTMELEKQNLLQQLEKEQEQKQKLLQQQSKFKATLKAVHFRLHKFFQDVLKWQAELKTLNSRIMLLKAENKMLIGEKEKLISRLAEDEGKLSSISELRKILRDLRTRTPINRSSLEGNHGYLIKEGKVLTPPKRTVEVIPLSLKE